MKNIAFLFLFPFLCFCQSQSKPTTLTSSAKKPIAQKLVGGGCEGCELMYIGMPAQVSSLHTSMGWTEGGQKLKLTGTVYQLDGKTPAAEVIIYYYHTDDKGLYTADQQTPADAKRHGKLRGWVKSDNNGKYTILTSRPAAYPGDEIAQHIHLSIKEPTLNEYYADLYFEDDPLYKKHQKKYGRVNRAGNELLSIVMEGKVMVAKHDVVLGLNIPDYPGK